MALGLLAAGWASNEFGIFFNALFIYLLVMAPLRLVESLWRAYRGTLELRFWREPLARDLRGQLAQALNGWVFWLLAALTLEMCIVPAQFTDVGYWVIHALFWGAVAVLMFLELLPAKRIHLASNLALAAGSLFMAAQMARIYWPESKSLGVVLSLPVRGDWLVVNGGRSALINVHYPLANQRNALDLERLVDGKEHSGDSEKVESFPSWGAQVYAPADGKISEAVDGLDDNSIGHTDREHLTGNHIVIDIGGNRFVLLAHLQKGSVLVAPGEAVHTGQPIAKCGNSGNTSHPHLHLQAQNQPHFLLSGITTYPILFRETKAVRFGQTLPDSPCFVRRNDEIESETARTPPPIAHLLYGKLLVSLAIPLTMVAIGFLCFFIIRRLGHTGSRQPVASTVLPSATPSSGPSARFVQTPRYFSRKAKLLFGVGLVYIVIFSLLFSRWWSWHEPIGVWFPTRMSESIGELYGEAQLRVTEVTQNGQVVLVKVLCDTSHPEHELFVQYSGPVFDYPADLATIITNVDYLVAPSFMNNSPPNVGGQPLLGTRELTGRWAFTIGFVLPEAATAAKAAEQVRQVHLGKPRGLKPSGSTLLLFSLHRKVGFGTIGEPIHEMLSGMLCWPPEVPRVKPTNRATNSAAANTSNLSAAPEPVFGPVIERVIAQAQRGATNWFLNLKTGELLTPPQSLADELAVRPGSLNLESLPRNRAEQFADWAKKAGADLLVYGAKNLEMLGGFSVPAHGNNYANWDDLDVLTPRQARESIQPFEKSPQPAEDFRLFGLQPRGVLTREQSVNYFFKTRDGALGVLQIVGPVTAPPGVKIRYKLVQSGNASINPKPAEFQSYVVNKTWEELSRQPNPDTPETVEAAETVGLMEDDPATVVNKYVIDFIRFPPGMLKVIMPQKTKQDALESRTLKVLVYRSELAGVISFQQVEGGSRYLTGVLGRRNGQWKIWLDGTLAEAQTLAEAEGNFKSRAAELWSAFQKVPDAQPGLVEEAGKELATNLSAVIGPLISAAGQLQQQAATQMVTNMSAIVGSMMSAAGQIQQQVAKQMASQQSGVVAINGQQVNTQGLNTTSKFATNKERARFEFHWVAADEDASSTVDVLPDVTDPPSQRKLRVLRDVVLDERDLEGVMDASSFMKSEPGTKAFYLFLNEWGRQKFGAASAQNIGHQLAIVWRGRVISISQIQSALESAFTVRLSRAEETELKDLLDNRSPGGQAPPKVPSATTNK